MSKKLKVEGMHCHACAQVITMELEERELADKVISVGLTSEGGVLEVVDEVSSEDLEKIKTAVSEAGHYAVEGEVDER